MNILERMPDLRGCYFLTPAGTIGRYEDSGFRVDADFTRALARPIAAFIQAYQRDTDTAAHRIAIVHTDHADKPWQSHTLAFEDAVLRELFPVPGAGALTSFQQRNREKSLYRGMELLLDYRHAAIQDLPYYCPVLVYRNTRLDQYRSSLGRPARAGDGDTPVVEVINLFGEVPLLDPVVDDYLRSLRTAVVKPERRSAANLYLIDEARPGSNGARPAAAPVTPQPAAADPYVADPAAVGELLSRFGASRFRDWDYGFWLDRHCSGTARFRFSQQLRAMAGARRAGVETLRGFDRMKDFDPQARQLIAAKNPLFSMPAGSVLLDAGSSDAWNLYLVSGEVELIAADGQRSAVAAGSAAARRPLALLKPRQYTVMARTPVQCLWLYEPMISAIAQLGPAAATRAGAA